MKCIRSFCRLEIPEGAKFCPSCGKKQPSMTTDPDTPLVWDGKRTTCPRCLRETPAGSDSVFCAWCRMRLPVKQAPAVPIPVKLSGRIKACIRPCCSKAIPEEALFCPWCGKQQQARPKPPRKRRQKGTGTVYKLQGKRAKPYVAKNVAGDILGYYADREEALKALDVYNAGQESVESPKEAAQSASSISNGKSIE